MTANTLVFLVTLCTELGIARRDPAMRVHEVRTVLRSPQPTRREQLPVRILRPNLPRGLGQVTGRTPRFRIPP